jgi:DNA-binding response OmpR family regulator
MHGGTISAKSDGLGFGSEFTVRLPDVEATTERRNNVTKVPGGEACSAQRVLVVDDNEDTAVMLSTLLEIHGYKTSLAHDGRAAIAAADLLRPEVILLDIGLPGLNGFDVSRQIRAQPWGTDMVLIALTGWGQESDRNRSRDSGFDYHLVKPVEQDSLLRLMASVHPRGTVPEY